MLLTSWTNLNTWIKENRQAIALRNRLNDDVARWQARKVEDELWGGSKLEQVLELRKNSNFNQVLGGFNEVANQFIDTSVRLREHRRRKTIAVTLAFAATIAASGVLFKREQQGSIQTIEAVVIEGDTTKILNSLPQFLEKADTLSNEGNIEQALPYYRWIREGTLKLLSKFKENHQEEQRLKIQNISDKSEEGLAQAIKVTLLKNLENDLNSC